MLKIPTISEAVNQRGTCNTIAKTERKAMIYKRLHRKYWATQTLLKPEMNNGTPEGLADPAQPVTSVKFVIWCVNRVRCKYAYIDTNNI